MTIEEKMSQTGTVEKVQKMSDAIRNYWNIHIHDLEIAKHPLGSKEFFEELADYRFEKLDYLPKVVDFTAYKGKILLEVGCGIGIDLLRFAQHGAVVTGIDLSDTAIKLAGKNFDFQGFSVDLRVMDGEQMDFSEAVFDVVYAHGVLQYTDNIDKMVGEIHRVLKPGGKAILMVYNRISWLNALSKLLGVKLEHEDAPILNKYSIREFKKTLKVFPEVEIIPERFPVVSRLHGGLKGALYNSVFVGIFNLLPRFLVRPFGWHIMAMARK